MIYSKTVKYALLALSYLALNKYRLVKVKKIAEAQKIPKPLREVILDYLNYHSAVSTSRRKARVIL
ncbi:Rrf2 family transcriptional regulator [Hydrogenobacter hydrogenophilus]|uniref:Transcriptional regulator n=1 Tax=Hydrogenobacter hydrogenophilus TaxID=35835 RepID=A0A285NWN8_9AQUI|nr:Rrf2 family transcriptional regulator [Hydrogenobacter hydrogenophilus]SNZ12051.1 Transcriptional regulator [Hydrogenobacter hydrogenophilus]